MDAVLCRLPSGLALLYHTSGVGGMSGSYETPAPYLPLLGPALHP